MQRDLVEQRRWISKEDYVEGLAFSQLSQVARRSACHVSGWCGRAVGARPPLASPSSALVSDGACLGGGVRHFGNLSWIQGVFYGIGAAVIAIIGSQRREACEDDHRRDWLLWAMFAAVAMTTAWTESEFVLLFILCGIIAMAVKAPPLASFPSPAAWLPSADWLVSGLHVRRRRNSARSFSVLAKAARSYSAAPGNRAVPLRAVWYEISLADRTAVSRRRGCCDDYTRPSRHHSRVCGYLVAE